MHDFFGMGRRPHVSCFMCKPMFDLQHGVFTKTVRQRRKPMGTYWVGREGNQREETTSTTLININIHRHRNGRGHGGHGPLTFQTKLFLKSFFFS